MNKQQAKEIELMLQLPFAAEYELLVHEILPHPECQCKYPSCILLVSHLSYDWI
jgi:hypothetical protein